MNLLDPSLTLYPAEKDEPYAVEFASIKYPGDVNVTRYASLSEAVLVCRTHHQSGKTPRLKHARFTATPHRVAKDSERATLQWSMTFDPIGIYKSLECRRAETAGVRYMSHRRGYVASDRAFYRFCAIMEGDI